MKINLITRKEWEFLVEMYKNFPNLTLQNDGYEYIKKDTLTDNDKGAILLIEKLLRQKIVGFSEFNNFRLSKKEGLPQIRLQYQYGPGFTGVGYILVDELLYGFKDGWTIKDNVKFEGVSVIFNKELQEDDTLAIGSITLKKSKREYRLDSYQSSTCPETHREKYIKIHEDRDELPGAYDLTVKDLESLGTAEIYLSFEESTGQMTLDNIIHMELNYSINGVEKTLQLKLD